MAETTDITATARDSRAVLPGADPPGATVESLARALELHDYWRGRFGETGAHTRRVARLALRLAHRVAPQLVRNPQLAYGFRLHDIGMIGVSTAILLKTGPLTQAELDDIREHPWIGERIVAPMPSLRGLTRDVIASHHERWDGTGYPRGLSGGEIPLAARIFAIADAFEAMTNDQPYRDALPVEYALAEIASKAGSDFDPRLAEAFLGVELDGEAAAAQLRA
jgi:HD-GYP domain-containing protein (c-di-GMP phosphodiesterase class II)